MSDNEFDLKAMSKEDSKITNDFRRTIFIQVKEFITKQQNSTPASQAIAAIRAVLTETIAMEYYISSNQKIENQRFAERLIEANTNLFRFTLEAEIEAILQRFKNEN